MAETIESTLAENRALRAEIELLRSTFRDTMDRAEMADTYEAWLLDIGKTIGCQHLDEQLPNCVIRELQGDGQDAIDAARYRWLKERIGHGMYRWLISDSFRADMTMDDKRQAIDTEIDLAMEQTDHQQGAKHGQKEGSGPSKAAT